MGDYKQKTIKGPATIFISDYRMMVHIGNIWFCSAGIVLTAPSLVRLAAQKNRNVTEFHDFFSSFGLSLADVFRENPDDTSKLILNTCEGARNMADAGKSTSHMIEGFAAFLAELKNEPNAAALCEKLEKTLKHLGVADESLVEEIQHQSDKEPKPAGTT